MMQTLQEMFEELNGKHKPSVQFSIAKAGERPTKGHGNPTNYDSQSVHSSENQNPANLKSETTVDGFPYVSAVPSGENHNDPETPRSDRHNMKVSNFALGSWIGPRHLFVKRVPSNKGIREFKIKHKRDPVKEDFDLDYATGKYGLHIDKPTNDPHEALWVDRNGNIVPYDVAMADPQARPMMGNSFRNSQFMNIASNKKKDYMRDLQISSSEEYMIDLLTRSAVQEWMRKYGNPEQYGLSEADLYGSMISSVYNAYHQNDTAINQARKQARNTQISEWDDARKYLESTGAMQRAIDDYENSLKEYNEKSNQNADAYEAGEIAPHFMPKFKKLHYDYYDDETGEPKRSYGRLISQMIQDELYDRKFESDYGHLMDPELKAQGAYKGIRPKFRLRGQPVYADDLKDLLMPLGFTEDNFENRNVNDEYFDRKINVHRILEAERMQEEIEKAREMEELNKTWSLMKNKEIDDEFNEAMERGQRAKEGMSMYGDEGKAAFNYPWTPGVDERSMADAYFNFIDKYGKPLSLNTSEKSTANLLSKILKPSGMTLASFKALPSSEKLKLFMKNSPQFAGIIDQFVKGGILDPSRFEDNSLEVLDMISASPEIREKLSADKRLLEDFNIRRRLADEGPGDNSAVKRLIKKIVDDRLTDLTPVQKLHDNIMNGLSPGEQEALSERLVSLMEGNQSLINRENRTIPRPAGTEVQGNLLMDRVNWDKTGEEGVGKYTPPMGRSTDGLEGYMRKFMDNQQTSPQQRAHALVKYAGETAYRDFQKLGMDEDMAKQLVEMMWDLSEDPSITSAPLLFRKVYDELGATENGKILGPLKDASKYIMRARESMTGADTFQYDPEIMAKTPSLKELEGKDMDFKDLKEGTFGQKVVGDFMAEPWSGSSLTDKDFDYQLPSSELKREIQAAELDKKNAAKYDERNKGIKAAEDEAKELKIAADQKSADQSIQTGMEWMGGGSPGTPPEVPEKTVTVGKDLEGKPMEATFKDTTTPQSAANIGASKPPDKIEPKELKKSMAEETGMESLRDMMNSIMKKGDKAGHPYGRPIEGNVFAYGSTISKMGEDKDPVMPKEIKEADVSEEGISRKKLDIPKI